MSIDQELEHACPILLGMRGAIRVTRQDFLTEKEVFLCVVTSALAIFGV